MPNNIAVSITADVADLTAKRAIASAELRALNKDLNDLARQARTGGLNDALRTQMLAAGDAAAKASNSVKLINKEMAELNKGGAAGALDKALAGGLEKGVLERGAAQLGMFGGALEALGPAGMVAAAGLAATAFAAEQAMKGAEWAEQLKRASSTLGLTTTQLQEFDFAFNAMGIDVQKGRETLSGLEKTIGLVESGLARSMQTKAFTDGLKITPDDLRGWGTLEQQLPHILDSLSKLDPEERSAIASRLKVDPEVITSLIDERARLRELIDEAHRYGIVVSADVVDQSGEAAGKMREWKAIIDGELRVAFIELAPTIASAAQTVANATEKFADLIKGVQVVATDIGQLIGKVESSIPGIDGLAKSVGGLASALMGAAGPLGTVLGGLGQLADIGHAARAAEDKANTAKDVVSPQTPKPVELSAPKAKKGHDDIVAQWREQLQKKKEDDKDYWDEETAGDLAFWQAKLALTKKGSKDWLAVQTEVYNANKAAAHKAFDADMKALDAKAAADKDSWSKYRADLQAELDRIKGTPVKPGPGVNSQEYQDQLTKIADAEREHNEKMIAMQDEVAQHAVKSLSDSLDAQMSILKTRAETAKALNDEKGKSSITGPFGDVSASQKNMAIDRQTAEQELALEQQKMAAQLAADQSVIDAKAKLYDGDVERYRDALQKKADDEQQFQNKIRVMQVQMAAQQTQATLKIQQAWSSAITPMVDSFGNGIKGMIEGTENLHTALRGIADTILGVVITSIERWVAAQIVAAIMGQAAGVTSTKSQVAAAAGLAGANGVASMAAAPFPLDLGAPAFGAAMSMAALAFGAFDQGMDVVPDDMVAQIHAGERIVPAADNSAIISALSGGGGGGSGPAFNYSPTINSPHTTWGDLLRNHGSEMKGWVRNQMRNGKLR